MLKNWWFHEKSYLFFNKMRHSFNEIVVSTKQKNIYYFFHPHHFFISIGFELNEYKLNRIFWYTVIFSKLKIKLSFE